MAQISPQPGFDSREETTGPRRRKAVRLLVPLGVAGAAAATISLGPALASAAKAPDLPKVSAEELLTKLAKSDPSTLSGTVRFSVDLGIPELPAGGSSGAGGGPFGGGAGGRDEGDRGQRGQGDDSSQADPRTKLPELLTGTHTLRVAMDGPDKQRLSVLEKAAEYSLIHNGADLWAYDSRSNEVFHTKAAERSHGGDSGKQVPEGLPMTPEEAVKQTLKAVDPTTEVTVSGTTTVAGHDAYQLRIAPKQTGSTIGSIVVAVDADTGVALKYTVSAVGGGKPVFDIGFTDVSFAKPAGRNFEFAPPRAAKVTEGTNSPKGGHDGRRGLKPFPGEGMGRDGMRVTGEGWTSVVQLKLPTSPLGKAMTGRDSRQQINPMTALEGLGDRVSGDFGKGVLVNTRLFKVLITDDGKVYAGAVTKATLMEAAKQGR